MIEVERCADRQIDRQTDDHIDKQEGNKKGRKIRFKLMAKEHETRKIIKTLKI